MIDAHAHLEFLKGNLGELVEECRRELRAIVDSITEYRKTHVWKSWTLLEPYFGFVFPTLGYHPNEARRGNWEKVRRVEAFIREHASRIYAVGEIGLDYFHARSERERENQRTIFRHFLELALELNLPVVIHAREAEEETFELVQRYGVRAYFHSYTGDHELAREIVENGHYIGISTGIAFIPQIREVVRTVEVERILIETDAPYMSPFKGVRNRPTFVKVAAKAVAELKGLETKEVERVTERNAIEFFSLPL
ncbi:YchF/TatD family DNA exonuclease [Pyrococcus yayanosii]|uniref:TatD-related deoxyribonuclease n=1 Tax=Pyrococcus yayanosii (strain CH1 / JCM 16557) TaxID=529709 RepID=F8AEA8_PYRYC|nr:YchF/TatD family DNA exonuclease [Pyrococcus yayanosii]AEH24619.1 TatD-related deoxyribonuclease [Pyrococcus yayanosii CH1]